MRKLSLMCLMWVISAFTCASQTDEDIRAIVSASGVAGIEELDEYEMEMYWSIMTSPVRINVEGSERLISAGLLTPFQAASLKDYIERHGDILSLTELSAMDGFNPDVVEVLSPFISLDSVGGIMKTSERRVKYETAVRTFARMDGGDPDYGYSAKLRVGNDDLSGALSISRPYGMPDIKPQLQSFNLTCRLPVAGLELFAGDFNARFGQGLVMWNGMSVTGVASPTSCRKNSPGLSPTWSFSGSNALTGLATRLKSRDWTLSAAMAFPQLKKNLWTDPGDVLLPMINYSWFGMYGQMSLTHMIQFEVIESGKTKITDMKTSMDGQICVDGTNIYSEVAYDWQNRTVAALGGTDWSVCEDGRLGTHLRYYPSEYLSSWSAAVRSSTKCSNEYGLAFSGEFPKWIFSMDAAYYPVPKVKDALSSVQLKVVLRWKPRFGEMLDMDFRLVERWRSWGIPFKTDFRSDVHMSLYRWTFSARFNVLKFREFGLLMYLEESWKNDSLSFHLRQGVFKVDNWDDRIYVYERDAPGSFNVPSFYGRGVWASAYGGWKFSRSGHLYLRMFYITYPFALEEKRKPGKAELRIQFTFKL